MAVHHLRAAWLSARQGARWRHAVTGAARRAAASASAPCADPAPPSSGGWSPSCLLSGASAGAAAALAVAYAVKGDPREEWYARLPRQVILVRHGESEGNADHTLYRTKADNLIELTPKGSEQAVQAGKTIKQLIGDDKACLYVSPFVRTLQTARNIRLAFENQITWTHVSPQLREQEFGNLQGDDFKRYREEQNKVGRLFYRFPTGESGCDVYDRTKSWWENVMQVNEDLARERVDTVIAVTHGLTMRLILMQLNGWSPTTFHTVWNAGNCDVYVLRKVTAAPGRWPYVLDGSHGTFPKSSINVHVKLSTGEEKTLLLTDYLLLPQPRTQQFDLARKMLAEQHGLDADSITHVDFWNRSVSRYR